VVALGDRAYSSPGEHGGKTRAGGLSYLLIECRIDFANAA
jgi:hypothetical protein